MAHTLQRQDSFPSAQVQRHTLRPCVYPAMLSQGRVCSPGQCAETLHVGEFICPICLELISDAVWLVNTRQLYDRRCLVHWFEAGALFRNQPQTLLCAAVPPFALYTCLERRGVAVLTAACGATCKGSGNLHLHPFKP